MRGVPCMGQFVVRRDVGVERRFVVSATGSGEFVFAKGLYDVITQDVRGYSHFILLQERESHGTRRNFTRFFVQAIGKHGNRPEIVVIKGGRFGLTVDVAAIRIGPCATTSTGEH